MPMAQGDIHSREYLLNCIDFYLTAISYDTINTQIKIGH